MTINDTLKNALAYAGQRICKPRLLELPVQKTMALASKPVSTYQIYHKITANSGETLC